MENSTENVTSTQKKLPPTHNPGWNDPPSWAFKPAQSPTTGTAKRTLSKRIAFPLSSAQSPARNDANYFVPTPATNSACPSQNILTGLPGTKDEQSWKDLMCSLEKTILKYGIAGNDKAEIERILNMMKTEWFEIDSNNSVRKKIIDISDALQEGNVNEAERIHFELVSVHGNLYKSWINNVKSIIDNVKNNVQKKDLTPVDSKE